MFFSVTISTFRRRRLWLWRLRDLYYFFRDHFLGHLRNFKDRGFFKNVCKIQRMHRTHKTQAQNEFLPWLIYPSVVNQKKYNTVRVLVGKDSPSFFFTHCTIKTQRHKSVPPCSSFEKEVIKHQYSKYKTNNFIRWSISTFSWRSFWFLRHFSWNFLFWNNFLWHFGHLKILISFYNVQFHKQV